MSAPVLGKYDVNYYKCVSCQFIQTETPYWLPEAYSSAIANLDIGLISRNEVAALLVQAIAHHFFDRQGRYVDYGGGYGMLVRMMRDRGYNFSRFDTYCENLFANGFDVYKPDPAPSFTLLTAFEVFEHLENPIEDVRQMLAYSRSILLSTELQPAGLISPKSWWYVLPETGQHIALYSRRSMEVLAEQFNLRYYGGKNNFHLLTDQPVNGRLFTALTDWRIARIYNMIARSRQVSLLDTDYRQMREKFANESIL
ncbi:hypothetical protein GCM10028805_11570 [Spirosoma harenae]